MKTAIFAAILAITGTSAFAGEIKLPTGSYCLNASNNQGLGLESIKVDGTSSKFKILKASEEKNGCFTIDLEFRDTGKKFSDATLCEYPGSC